MSTPHSIRIETANAAFDLRVGDDGHLLQLGFCSSESDEHCGAPAFPSSGDGWVFEPALRAIHSDGNTSTDLRFLRLSRSAGLTRIELKDPAYPFFVDICYQTYPELDVIETWAEIHHEESAEVVLTAFASCSLDLGKGDCYLTQFHGNWNDEMHMAEERLGYGIKILDSKLGVRANQFCAPWFLLAKNGPARETEGEVFAGSLAWSGSFRFSFEKLPNGHLNALCGINPFASQYHLAPGERFATPKMVWAHSTHGTRQLSQNLHQWTRQNVLRDPEKIRSIILNNWEATYFDFNEAKITSLFDGAKDLGMETFLLDDGWFGVKHARDDDSRGLGDWTPDPKKLPNGIGALVEAAAERGLRFGIWIEPEMLNPKSELFERHPEWAIQQPKRDLDLQRNQLVLDLTRPEVKAYVYDLVNTILGQNPGISYVKWDCNRYLTQPGSPFLAPDRQSHLWIEYVRALYEIFGQVALSYPNVEIMMCSGGGGRVDYGAMRYAQEFWPSDNTDPARRIFIQWGYSHFYPANAISAHVTRMGKRPIKFAFDVAMSGRLGVDMDVDELSDVEQSFAKRAIENYKRIRTTVQQGTLYRLESPYEGPRSSLMYVGENEAVLFIYSLSHCPSRPVDVAGLDPKASYRIREINRLDGEATVGDIFNGDQLLSEGLPLPEMDIYSSGIFVITAIL